MVEGFDLMMRGSGYSGAVCEKEASDPVQQQCSLWLVEAQQVKRDEKSERKDVVSWWHER